MSSGKAQFLHATHAKLRKKDQENMVPESFGTPRSSLLVQQEVVLLPLVPHTSLVVASGESRG